MQRFNPLPPIAIAAALLAGCSGRQEPAQQAVASLEQSLAQLRPDAARYAPEQLASAEARLDTLEKQLASEDYKAVLAAASEVREEVVALNDAIVARQTQMTAATHEWEDLSEEVPRMVQAIENQVMYLPRAKRDAAAAELERMKSLWAEAASAFEAGDPTQAADKGRLVQAKGKEVIEQLGMSPV